MAALGVDAGISKSEVSRIGVQLDEELNEFRERPLLHLGSSVLSSDATYVQALPAAEWRGRPVVSCAVVVVTGAGTDIRRGVLGITIGDVVDGALGAVFLQSLRGRGLLEVPLLIGDSRLGRQAAKVFLGASWQHCRVHLMRNVLWKVPNIQ